MQDLNNESYNKLINSKDTTISFQGISEIRISIHYIKKINGLWKFEARGEYEIFWTDSDINRASKLTFEIPNLNPHLAKGSVKGHSSSDIRKRISLTEENFVVHLDTVKKSDEIWKYLKSNPGYQSTYIGCLSSLNEQLIPFEECKRTLNDLTFFLSFINGSRVGPCFVSGYENDKLFWKNGLPFVIDQSKYTNQVFKFFPSSKLQNLWDSYRKVSKEPPRK